MLKNYFTIAWRNLLRNKGYSAINISGLAIGMAVAILIGLWVQDELNVNRSFKNYDRLGLIYHNLSFEDQILTNDGLPYLMGSELKNNYSEFEEVAITSQQAEHVLSFGDKKLSKPGYFVDPQFTEMFSLQMKQGTRAGLKDVHSIMLSKTLADALLGEDAVGKMIKFDNHDYLMVTGVFEDFPLNSQFEEIKMLVSMDYYFTLDKKNLDSKTNWGSFDFLGYVLLKDKASFEVTESKMKNLCYQKTIDLVKAVKPEGILFPMAKWHLYGDFKDGKNVGGKIKFVWMFGMVGIFVLILACINFMNLSTARSEKRSKEIGVRKVMGSIRSQLIKQFLSESLLVAVIGFVLSLGIVTLSLPWFNDLSGKNIALPLTNFYFILLSFVFVLMTGLVAGSYPAIYLSSFNPIKVLKGIARQSRFAALPRRVMVVFQFTVSIALIIGTAVVFQQIQLAKKRPAGFNLDRTIYIEARTGNLIKANYNSLRHDFLSTGMAENMATSDFPITGGMTANTTTTWAGKNPTTQPLIAMNSCSHDFPKTSGFVFREGRDFSRELSTDSSAMMVNETAAKLISSQSVLGKKVTWDKKEREIIAVIKDQVKWSPFERNHPHFYYVKYAPQRFITIKIKDDADTQSALKAFESVLKKYDPGAPFDYEFIDKEYARMFKDEERIGKLASVFASLAIFISCIGIFGLASFAASQREKEIGIRKILGASVFRLWKMLSRDFVWLVIASFVIATPIAFYFSNQWLQQYEYRIEVSWWIFIAAGISTLLITLLTVSYQSIKAALINPVKSLRSE